MFKPTTLPNQPKITTVSTPHLRAPKLKGSTWFSYFDIAGDPKTRVRRSLKTKDFQEAERLNRLWFEQANGGLAVYASEDGVRCPLPLADAVLRYDHHDPRTATRLREFVKFVGGETFVHQIRQKHVHLFALDVKQQRGMKFTSLATWRVSLSQFFRRMLIEERCLTNPTRGSDAWPVPGNCRAANIEKLAEEKRMKDVGAPSPEERDRLFKLADASNQQLAMAVRLAHFAGCERSAIVRIKHSDVNFAKETIHVRGTKNIHRDDLVPLVPELADYLRSKGVGAGDPDQYLVFHAYGNTKTPITAKALGCKMERFNKRHGSSFHLHTGRHDLASRVHASGGDNLTIAKLLRHGDQGRTAAKYYIRTKPTDYAETMKKALA